MNSRRKSFLGRDPDMLLLAALLFLIIALILGFTVKTWLLIIAVVALIFVLLHLRTDRSGR